MSIALTKAVRSTLTADEGVTDLVDAMSIFSRLGRPETFPCVILGETVETSADTTLEREHTTVNLTLHVWERETRSLAGAHAIATAIRKALKHGPGPLEAGRCIDFRFNSMRLLRDPDGRQSSHAVLGFEALLEDAP